MIIPHGLTAQEIRVLQEYRRTGQQTLTMDEVRAIRHPEGGGEAPARGLASKGYVTIDASSASATLTEKGSAFLERQIAPAR